MFSLLIILQFKMTLKYNTETVFNVPECKNVVMGFTEKMCMLGELLSQLLAERQCECIHDVD
jgi:hypothetical protein